MPSASPIQTIYKGYRFRSRTEARWAVFFDEMRIAWEYEKDGYQLADGTWYLPDFWLPDHQHWVEVKGAAATDDEREKLFELHRKTGHPVLLLEGIPELQSYYATEETPDGELYLIDVVLGMNVKEYVWHEKRFYMCSLGDAYPEREYWEETEADPLWTRAVRAAKQARFEHGESPI